MIPIIVNYNHSSMQPIIQISSSPVELASSLAEELSQSIRTAAEKNKTFTLALSGGNTPALLFSILAEYYGTSIPWKNVHLFWGDERCVPSYHNDSNYGMTKIHLLDKVAIPAINIHRIHGEDDPIKETERYAHEILEYTDKINNIPSFDYILLGLGTDGHTASIFPGYMDLFQTQKICELTLHPQTRQKRITLTGPVINNSRQVAFLVTGKSKASVVADIINKTENAGTYPASCVALNHGKLKWYLDSDASALL